jgi:hypothetical protein
MTPKEKVLKRNPQAHAQREGGVVNVYPAPFGAMAVRPSGSGATFAAAWLDAARNMGLAA